ncbi:hypothetical protein [Streptomyces sp. NPDC057509]|uniref:hypothetical protein n=1 Tax=Streptomyces sp. NPDC057509 TaxID=3346152 RepID=UPI0036C631D9
MNECKIACAHDSLDVFTAGLDGGVVRLTAQTHGVRKVDAFVDPADARAFARGILALADEVDGGEANEAPEAGQPFKVGDKVRTVREIMGLHRGRSGELADIDVGLAPRFLVNFPDGRSVWAYDIEPDTTSPEPKLGDTVRITQEYSNAPGPFAGMTGTLVKIDPQDSNLPYMVRGNGGTTWENVWAHAVKVVETVKPVAEGAVVPSRDALVARAKEHLAGTPHSAADIIRLAEFLMGE